MTDRAHVPLRAGLPALDRAIVQCPICHLTVRVLVVRDFLAMIRRLAMRSGVTLAKDFPSLVARCDRGHIVVVPFEQVELAS